MGQEGPRRLSIPKGEPRADQDPLTAARREFAEETGIVPAGAFIPLDPIRQAGGKGVRAFALEGDCDPATIESNTFVMEWPPRSGRTQTFPEVDRAAWFTIDEARRRIVKGQAPLLEQLCRLAADSGRP